MAKDKFPPINNNPSHRKFIPISKAAEILGLSPDTLRNWEKERKLIPLRTKGGARRYSSKELIALKKEITPFPNKKKGLLTVRQAATALNVSPDTIRNWGQKGFIEVERTRGGARRFTRAEIARLQKELGINTLQAEKAISPVPNFVPEVHKFKPGFRKIFLTVGFLLTLILFFSLAWSIPSLDDWQVAEIKKQINAIAASLESLQSGVLGIQTQFLASDSAVPKPQTIEKIIQIPSDINVSLPLTEAEGKISCKSCLTADSGYVTSVGVSDDSLKLNSEGKKVNLSLKLDHANSWDGIQTFNKGILANYSGGVPESVAGQFTALNQPNLSADSRAVGIMVTATGADYNFSAVFDQGNVGVGTTFPVMGKLMVAQGDNSQPAIYIDSEQSLSTQPVLQIESDTINGSGSDTVKLKITADGSVFSDAAIFSAPADLAEMYYVKEEVEEGDVVELMAENSKYAVRKADEDSGNPLFGVISEKPGQVLGYDSKDESLSQQKPVSLAGRVSVKVSNEGGPIRIGDYLTGSKVAGVAKKATRSGFVIGKALEDFSGDVGKILVIINVSYAQINSELSLINQTSGEEKGIDKLNLTPPEILLASESAELSDLRVTERLSSDKLMIAQDIKVSGELKVFGQTILGSTNIAGDLTVDGTFSIEKGNEINVAGGLLFLQKSPLAQGLDIMNGLVIIDKKGNIRSQSITVAEFKVVANKISGSGIIKKGESFARIDNGLVQANSRILITPTSISDLVLAVTKKETGRNFTVSAPKETEEDIGFDFFLINEAEP